ncbi:MAG: zinc ABC transporter substrate-binding protein [Desulfohalobiaceae bacterium]
MKAVGKVVSLNTAIVLLVLLAAIWAWPGQVSADQNKIQVVVSIAPQKYFVQEIGGEFVDVAVLLPPGASPHGFEPKSSQMVELGQAQLYMAIGVGYEKTLLPRLQSMHPDLEIVHTDKGIKKMPMLEQAQQEQGHEQEDQQAGLDPHVWLAPDLVLIQAQNIYQALAEAMPEKKADLQENLLDLQQEILQLHQEILAALQGISPGSKFMVLHPAWGYFARTYGLVQVPIEVEGKEPKARHLRELIEQAKQEGIRAVFVSPQFSESSARTIADSISGEIVSIDPLGRNWKQNMLKVADKLQEAMQDKP